MVEAIEDVEELKDVEETEEVFSFGSRFTSWK